MNLSAAAEKVINAYVITSGHYCACLACQQSAPASETIAHRPDCVIGQLVQSIILDWQNKAQAQKEPVPADVRRLVIAARVAAFEDHIRDDEVRRELDRASEAFADRVPWDEDPGREEAAEEAASA